MPTLNLSKPTYLTPLPPSEFKVTTLKNPLLLKQAVTSKRNPNT